LRRLIYLPYREDRTNIALQGGLALLRNKRQSLNRHPEELSAPLCAPSVSKGDSPDWAASFEARALAMAKYAIMIIARGHLRPYVPFLREATHPRCGYEGCPDWPGRASSKEGES
jgi:hypothetical protein